MKADLVAPPIRSGSAPRLSRRLWVVGVGTLAAAAAVIADRVDWEALARAWREAVGSPEGAGIAVVAFAGAFALRAGVWCRVVPGLGYSQALAALHVGLAGNHVLPLRMGEALRPLSAARRTSVSPQAAAASTLVLRVADVAVLLAIGAVAAPELLGEQLGWLVLAAPVVLVGGYVAGVSWLRRLPERQAGLVRLPGPAVLAGTAAAWFLEAVTVWQCAQWAGLDLTPASALVVTAASVAAQVAGVAPGGVGTYEAAAVAAYVALGFPAGPALAAALVTHALNTAYALAAGSVALFLPRPGMLRLTRPKRRPSSDGGASENVPGCLPGMEPAAF